MKNKNPVTPATHWDNSAYDLATDFQTIVNRSSEMFETDVYIQPIEADIEPLTFGQLSSFVRGFEVFLEQHGVGYGDACAIISHNSTALMMEFVALMATGRIFVPINPNSSVDEINFILEDSAPKALIYGESLEEKVDSVHDWCQLIKVSSDAEFIERMTALAESRPTLGSRPTADTVAEIIYTSGTTGRPKGVILSHRNLITDVFGLGQIFDLAPDDRFLTVAPLFHNSGQILTTLAPLYCGGTTTAIRSDMGFINFWHYVDEYQPTWTLVMPAHVALMLERANPSKHKSLKGILCGGAPLQREVQLAFEEKFCAPLYPNYGLTESTSVATCSRPGEEDRISGTAGKPLDINDVKIFKRGGEVADGIIGEVRIRGNNICKGYLNLPELTMEKIQQGWLHSGDLGFINDDGALQLVDRIDNMIIVGGENVYPTEVERFVPELQGMQEGIVLSLPDRIMGRELVLLYRGDGGDRRTKDWRNHLLSKLTSFKVPRRFIDVADLGLDEFPRSDNGKILRSGLQRQLEKKFGVAEEVNAPVVDSQRSFISDKTKSLIGEIMQIDSVRDDQQMDNTPSWDSVNHLQLVMTLEQSFGVTFNATQIAEMTSLESVVREVTKLKPE